jgi:hypothetical protein
MDWKDIASTVGKAAPILGTLLGGPAGAAVGSIIASALGTGNDPAEVERAIAADPQALLKLREKTGVRSPYVEQVGSWGSRDRDPRGWSTTHLYCALIADPGPLKAGANAADARWFPILGDGVAVPLAFDHASLLTAAVDRLRAKVEYTSLAAYLLPETFTLSELQHVFEIVLGRALEKSAFRRRVKDAGLVEEAEGMRTGAMRPAQLYRLAQRDAPVFFPRPLERRDD